jgi:hypothetical protein
MSVRVEGNRCYVYKLYRNSDDRLIYVGKGTRSRVGFHERECRNGRHINEKIQRCHDEEGGFYSVISHDNLSEDDAVWFEALYISHYGRECDGGSLYNLKPYGWGVDESTFQKMSKVRKGKPQSEAHRQNRSKALKGRSLSEDNKKNLSKSRLASSHHRNGLNRDRDIEMVKLWHQGMSYTKLSEKFGVNPQTVGYIIRMDAYGVKAELLASKGERKRKNSEEHNYKIAKARAEAWARMKTDPVIQ